MSILTNSLKLLVKVEHTIQYSSNVYFIHEFPADAINDCFVVILHFDVKLIIYFSACITEFCF